MLNVNYLLKIKKFNVKTPQHLLDSNPCATKACDRLFPYTANGTFVKIY